MNTRQHQTPQEIAEEEATATPKEVRTGEKRRKKIESYITGLLPSALSARVAVKISDKVRTAFVTPTNVDDIYDAESNEFSYEEAKQHADSTDADYLIYISTKPADLSETVIDDQYTADFAQQFGYALHEALHIFKTSFVGVNKLIEDEIDEEHQDTLLEFHNIVEDGAIENEVRTGDEFNDRSAARITFVRDMQAKGPEYYEQMADQQTVEFTFGKALDKLLYEEFIYSSGLIDAILDPNDERVQCQDADSRDILADIRGDIQRARDDIFAIRSDLTDYRVDREQSIKRTKRLIELWKDSIKPYLEGREKPDEQDKQNQPTSNAPQSDQQQESGESGEESGQTQEQGEESGDAGEQSERGESDAASEQESPDASPDSGELSPDENGEAESEEVKVEIDPDDFDTNDLQGAGEHPDIGRSPEPEDVDLDDIPNTAEDDPSQDTTPDDTTEQSETSSADQEQADAEEDASPDSAPDTAGDSEAHDGDDADDGDDGDKGSENADDTPENNDTGQSGGDVGEQEESAGDGSEGEQDADSAGSENADAPSQSGDATEESPADADAETGGEGEPGDQSTDSGETDNSADSGDGQTSIMDFGSNEDGDSDQTDSTSGANDDAEGSPEAADRPENQSSDDTPSETTPEAEAKRDSDAGEQGQPEATNDSDSASNPEPESGSNESSNETHTSEDEASDPSDSAEDTDIEDDREAIQEAADTLIADSDDLDDQSTEQVEQIEQSDAEPDPTTPEQNTPAHSGTDLDEETLRDDKTEAHDEKEAQSSNERELEQDLNDVTDANGTGAGTGNLNDVEILPDPDEETDADWDAIRDSASGIASVLVDQLDLNQNTEVRNDLTSGTQVNRKTLHRLVRGDPRSFQREREGDDKEYFFLIVLDRSGSMDPYEGTNKIDTAVHAVTRFAAACEQIGIKVGIVDFIQGKCRYVKPPSINAKKSLNRLLDENTGGGTPLGDALEIGQEIAEQRDRQSLIISITDDEPGDIDHTKEVIEQSPVPVCSLTIRPDCSPSNRPHKAQELAKKYAKSTYVFDQSKLDQRMKELATLIGHF